MSYIGIKPAYYQMNYPDAAPWHAGSRGWTESPWVTWGDNPNQVGLPRLGVGSWGTAVTVGAGVVGSLSGALVGLVWAAMQRSTEKEKPWLMVGGGAVGAVIGAIALSSAAAAKVA